MSTTTDRMPLDYARGLAQALEATLAPFCERTLIAGSIRRQKAEIGDIELVVMAKTEDEFDMFGAVSGWHSLLEDGLAAMGLTFTKNGAKFKQFTWQEAPVDLFIATPETWGCVATIRTGSSDFSHWLATLRKYGGGCPSHLHFKDARIWNGSTPLRTPEERDVFKALDLDWVPIEDRTDRRWVR